MKMEFCLGGEINHHMEKRLKSAMGLFKHNFQ